MTTKNRVRLTAGRVDAFVCPSGKSQAFLWDTESPALALRVSPTGRKTYVFESRLNGVTLRIPIGTVADWALGDARTRASQLKVLVDSGQDPRELERQQQSVKEAERRQAQAKALTVAEVWPLYLENGRPKRKDEWKPRYLDDLKKMAAPGGEKKKRGQGLTRPGPLHPLLALPLASIDEDVLKAWFDSEAKSGKHQAARALMMFRGFLRWCASRPEYRDLADREAGAAPAILESLPPNTRRTDKLLPEQIAGWWAGAERLTNRVHSVYLRALVLTGARREEVAALRWRDIDWRWKRITIADKVELARTIPLAPYMAHMLDSLPRSGEYVFHSASEVGHVKDARASMAKVLAECGVDHLTFHGLRRTFTQTARRIVPAGVPAQISGHKPSAVAEGYAILALDELRPYMTQIEAEFLRLADVQFSVNDVPGQLRAVK
ncbi:tyrosine-type recombinase/integrase [Comamonas sp. J-3]|uniref:tyrosine-type recombinase/integrase n=1 Tax=Comamonas trifloxystrobinivorans TaxID=3350256 RepID=UPI0037269D4C